MEIIQNRTIHFCTNENGILKPKVHHKFDADIKSVQISLIAQVFVEFTSLKILFRFNVTLWTRCHNIQTKLVISMKMMVATIASG